MFDWPQLIKRYWPAILLSLALILILDGTISSLETCHPPPNSPSASQDGNENCTVLQGPLASLIVGLGHFFETHDKGIVAAFTVILALSTIGLWIATISLYKSGERQIRSSRQVAAIQARQARHQFRFSREIADRQAKETQDQLKIARDSAAAAKQSADAAVAADRAWFYVEIDHNFLDCINAAGTWDGKILDTQDLAASNWPMAKIEFRNYGKSPGVVVEVGTGIAIWEIVSDPVYDVRVVMANVIPPNAVTENFATVQGPITLGQAKQVKRGTANIWIFGYVIYDDVFDQRHTHRFFQRFVPVSSGFRYVLQSYDYKHYNRST